MSVSPSPLVGQDQVSPDAGAVGAGAGAIGAIGAIGVCVVAHHPEDAGVEEGDEGERANARHKKLSELTREHRKKKIATFA